ncbi:hypothetical protein ACOJCM_19235 [Billgrantia sp. LNSP4103-1]|uniref:hypothetical protein n=1 Tax=Billgrantia sp. LNSP4103-1 TaxID=3410266 RepID=UPI00403F3156
MRDFLVRLIGVLLFMPAAALADCACSDFRKVRGEYTTVEISRYGGGLTPREEAVERIDKKALISHDHFSLWDELRYDSPNYKIDCHPVPQEEGEVPLPTERWGNFYGYGMDRNVIEVFSIFPSKQEGPRIIFEIVEDELWFFSDGWFYRMKRVTHD